MNGEILPLFIPSGFNAGNLDFGLFQRGALGDFVWEDKNGNGQQDSGEPGIAGIS
ncbi:MAG: hypothetical protein IPP49_18690 [Saprospiraceae bacterium]|nr:hypothetical protein [Saprospiraceae bacterium]